MNYYENINKKILNTYKSFNNFYIEDIINILEDEFHDNIKIKKTFYANKMLLEGNNFFYKIYCYKPINVFSHLYRDSLHKAYRILGIDWSLYTINLNDINFIDIEKREKLKICTNFKQEVLPNYPVTYKLFTKILGMDSIIDTVKAFNPNIKTLVLIRQDESERDYAVDKSNNIILIDDEEPFLVPISYENTILPLDHIGLDVSLKGYNFKIYPFETEYKVSQLRQPTRLYLYNNQNNDFYPDLSYNKHDDEALDLIKRLAEE